MLVLLWTHIYRCNKVSCFTIRLIREVPALKLFYQSRTNTQQYKQQGGTNATTSNCINQLPIKYSNVLGDALYCRAMCELKAI
jgi:hypothetical protein